MALAAALHPGFTYKVTEGPLEGELVTILDNIAVADGQPNQRKILVETGGQQVYMIPRQIDGTPVNKPVVAPIPVPTLVAAAQAAAPVVLASAPVVPVVTAHDIREVQAGVIEYSPITDPMDPRLDHLRPSISKVKQYIKREMPNGMTDVEFLLTFTSDAYRDKNQGRPANVMLKGDTQGGKTFLVEVLAVHWAEQLGFPKPMPIFTISGSAGVTDYDLFGQPASYYDPINGTEHIVWLPGQVDVWAHVGGILYVDEANALGERVTTSLHPVADHRHEFTNRNRPVKVPGDGFMAEVVTTQLNGWIIGTFNEGYRGMSDMNEAFLRRFRQIEWGYDKKVEQALVASATIHVLADAMRSAREGSKVRTPVGTATLEQLELDVESFGSDLALELFTSAFKASERPVVRQIILDRSIKLLLDEEIKANNLQNMGVV